MTSLDPRLDSDNRDPFGMTINPADLAAFVSDDDAMDIAFGPLDGPRLSRILAEEWSDECEAVLLRELEEVERVGGGRHSCDVGG